jgi:radical SAM superfamily enzyme YgiQ (UPF0313 family)
MKKKVLFVLLPFYVEHGGIRRKCPTMPYGVLSVAKYIEDVAEVRIFDCNLYRNQGTELYKVLDEFNPEVVGFNMMYDSCFLHLESMVDIVKSYDSSIPILLGGAATPYVYNEIIKKVPSVDAICYRDGEQPMREFLTTGRFDSSAWVLSGYDVPQKQMVMDLDKLIDIDYSLIDINAYQHDLIGENFSPFVDPDNAMQLYLMGSRGCNFSCTFCANSKNPDKKIRYASIDAIREHIQRLVDSYAINVLSLYDEQLLANVEWAKELFRMLAKFNLVIKIPGGITPIYVDEELVDLMWGAGVDAIGLAIESGSKRVLRLMRKPVDLDQVRRVMTYFRNHNFFIRAFLVIGVPGETDEERQMSLEFVRELKPDVVSPNIASPILGSKIRDECIEKGYIKTAELGHYDRMTPMISTPDCSAEHIRGWFDHINQDINFHNNYRMKVGDYETAAKYLRYVVNKYPHETLAKHYLEECERAML